MPLLGDEKSNANTYACKSSGDDACHDQVSLNGKLSHSGLWRRALQLVESLQLRVDHLERRLGDQDADRQSKRPVAVPDVEQRACRHPVVYVRSPAIDGKDDGEKSGKDHYSLGPFSSLMS